MRWPWCLGGAAVSVWVRRDGQILEAHALCHDCGWESAARNAAPNGARHARKYGHAVTTNVTMVTNYIPMDRGAIQRQVAAAALLNGDDPDEALERLSAAGQEPSK